MKHIDPKLGKKSATATTTTTQIRQVFDCKNNSS